MITFNQEVSFEKKHIEYISAYHPLVDSFKNYCIDNGIGSNQNFSLEIPSKDVNIEEGYYLLCSFNLKVNKLNLYGKETIYTVQKHIVFDLNKDEIPKIEENEVNNLVKMTQSKSHNTSLDINFSEDSEIIDILRNAYLKEAYTSRMKFTEKENPLFTSEMERKFKMDMEIFDIGISRINSYFESYDHEKIGKMTHIWNSKINISKKPKHISILRMN